MRPTVPAWRIRRVRHVGGQHKGIAFADIDVARLAVFLNAQRNITIYLEEKLFERIDMKIRPLVRADAWPSVSTDDVTRAR